MSTTLLKGWPNHQQLNSMAGGYQASRTNVCRTCLATCSYMMYLHIPCTGPSEQQAGVNPSVEDLDQVIR